MLDAQLAKVSQSSSKETVSHIVQLHPTTMERLVSPVLHHKNGTELNVLIDVIPAKSGTPPHKLAFAQPVNSGTDMPVLSVQMAEPGTLTLNHANAQSHPHGTESHVSPVLEEEFTTMLPTNANAQAAKLIMVMYVLSTAQLANSTMKLSRNVFAQEANTGTETSVFTVMVDKHGTQLLTLVFALQDQSGTDTHASIHVQVEEFWTLSVVNVSAQPVTGTVLLVSFAQILKSGQIQD